VDTDGQTILKPTLGVLVNKQTLRVSCRRWARLQ